MSELRVALITKPLVEPFHDGTKVLARDLVRGSSQEISFVYIGRPKRSIRWAAGDRVLEPWRTGALGVRAQTLALGGRDVDVLHGLFVPNAASSGGLRAIARARPRLAVVQTVTAGHGVGRRLSHLRGMDAVVCTSNATARVLRDAGIERVHAIHPGVELPATAGVGPRDQVMLYAGDLDGVTAHRLVTVGRALRPGAPLDGWRLDIVSRPKGEGDARARSLLRRALADLLARGVVSLEGTVPDLPERMTRCGALLFCAPHCARKVDVPLVVLEAMARSTPVLVVAGPPAQEVFEVGAAPGRLARSVDDLVRWLGGQSPTSLATLGESAREVAQAHFSAGTMAARYGELYRQVTRGGRTSRGDGTLPV